MKLVDVNNKNHIEEIWEYFHGLYEGVFEKIEGKHAYSDVIGNALIKDRLSRVKDFKMMSLYEIEEVRFFYRMIDSFDKENVQLFQKFSELYMQDLKEVYWEVHKEAGCEDFEISCPELGI